MEIGVQVEGGAVTGRTLTATTLKSFLASNFKGAKVGNVGDTVWAVFGDGYKGDRYEAEQTRWPCLVGATRITPREEGGENPNS